jgi:hypothetical protein
MKIAFVHLLVPMWPSLLDDITTQAHKPYHVPIVELHLIGVERTMFRNRYSGAQYNYAVGVEHIARNLGLVTTIGMN